MTARELRRLLVGYLFNFTSELELQDGIGDVLRNNRVKHEREAQLGPRDRIDFLVGSIGVEVKVGGGTAALIRQLHRYAQHETISELLVVTSRLRLRNIPAWLNGKRVEVLAFTPGIG